MKRTDFHLILKWAIVCLLSTALQTVMAGEFGTKNLKVDGQGGIFADGVVLKFCFADQNWSMVDQSVLTPEEGYPKSSGENYELSGMIKARSSATPILLREQVKKVDDRRLVFEFEAEHGEGIASNLTSLALVLNVKGNAGRDVVLNGAAFTLPASFTQLTLLQKENVTHITVPSKNGTISLEGNFKVVIQDDRKFDIPSYTIRFIFSPESKVLKRAKLAGSLSWTPYESTPISFQAQANMAFADEKADDQVGGWTDQGPENDLRSIPSGLMRIGFLKFNILSATENKGKSCLVLAGPDRAYFPKGVKIPVEGNPAFKNLYLLHSSAWTPSKEVPIGVLRVTYADGTDKSVEVLARRDISDWWMPMSVSNAKLGWVGENPSRNVCLFVSKFALDAKPVKEIEIESNGKAVWMIAGITGSVQDIQLPNNVQIPMTTAAGRDWVAYEQLLDIKEGSAFDFSKLNEAPAGKYGAIAVKNGHFEFKSKPGVRAKFWGVNLCFGANFLEKEQAETLALRLSRSGYNTARIHHYDIHLAEHGAKSYEFDARKLDQLDYLFAALKKQGIYINIDLYTFREFKKEEIPDLGHDIRLQIKQLLPVSEAAFQSWSLFAKNLLTHVNPYTGIAWGHDPALIGICPVNEDPLFGTPNKMEPKLKALYDERFAKWKLQHPGQGDDVVQFNRFLLEIQRDSDQRMHQFIRSLGVEVPITGLNLGFNKQASIYLREPYDYVDDHNYWDHPIFPKGEFSLPAQFTQKSATVKGAALPRELMTSRVFGKPFVVTEFHYCWPNKYRSEGGVLMSYASLQDWDALYNFQYAASVDSVTKATPQGYFSLSADPTGMLSDRIAAVMFRRGDVKPAAGAVAYLVNEATAYNGSKGWPVIFPEDYSWAGLVSRIGCLNGAGTEESLTAVATQQLIKAFVSDSGEAMKSKSIPVFKVEAGIHKKLADENVLPFSSIKSDGILVSETGELEISPAKGAMKSVTSRSECFVMPANSGANGNVTEVKNANTFASIYVLSVDDKPLAESRRILVLHLTDSTCVNVKFGNETADLLEAYGSLPHLIRKGEATITLRLNGSDPGKWQAWALASDGSRMREVALQYVSDRLQLDVATVTKEGTCLAYELSYNAK